MNFILLFLVSISFCLDLRLISDGLIKPVYLCSPQDTRNELYVVEQGGKVIKLDSLGNKSTFIDIQKKIKKPNFPGDERGLLGMAFHPNYKENGFFFLNYIDKLENTIISKLNYNKKKNKFDETILMKIKQPYSNHNGGQLAFGPDGYLYIALGDGGSSGDPDGNAQNLNSFLGKILRVDVNDSLYKIPGDNPFKNNKNAIDEIWAYGLRNPWRFSFNFKDNLISIADVGQNAWEEINIQKAEIGGLNYGWNAFEGSYPYNESIIKDQINPSFEYSSNANYARTLAGFKQKSNVTGCSITGGYFYEGKEITEIKDYYLFSDYCTGKFWGLKNENNSYILKEFSDQILKNIDKQLYVSSFGKDSFGEIYVVNHSGEIYKIIN